MRKAAVGAFVFLGAGLLFSLEPMVGRLLLPRFGGAFHVWTTTLMFFQGALFFAYLYAHLGLKWVGRGHLIVLALPLLALPPSVGQGPASEASLASILGLLVAHIALPFSVLATTSVVAQRWMQERGEDPYDLYAISNAGSLLALLAYALLIEPLIGLELQGRVWSGVYLAYLALGLWAWRQTRARPTPATMPPPAEDEESALPPEPISRSRLLYWLLLSAAPSMFLMAVTNLIALDAGSVPLVWIAPLGLYLGSFIWAFAKHKASQQSAVPGVFRRLWPHLSVVGLFFYTGGDAGNVWIGVGLQLVVLSFVCLAAHAALYRSRPHPEKLTLFYLVIALGGWAGGAVVALAAPYLFEGLWEYPLALVLLAATMGIGQRRALMHWLRTGPRPAILLSAALPLLIVWRVVNAQMNADDVLPLDARRSLYGLYRVTEVQANLGEEGQRVRIRDLISGTTRHGRQRVGDSTPLSYYHGEGPLGDVLSVVARPMHVGAVGLGVGAMAGHLRAGDRLRFYEIDPVVVELAERHFTYLSNAEGSVDIVVGDARAALSIEEPGAYDLLFIDAFAGDAIPTHLLTREAIELYLRHLGPHALLLFHVSNRYYDLRPALAGAATALGLSWAHRQKLSGLENGEDPSQYIVLSRRSEELQPLLATGRWQSGAESPELQAFEAFTDDHVNLLGALLVGP